MRTRSKRVWAWTVFAVQCARPKRALSNGRKSQKTAVKRDKQELLGQLGVSFFRLLGGVSISRSRRMVKKYYKEDMEDIGDFPHQGIPINRMPKPT